jgi:hypothetical protein
MNSKQIDQFWVTNFSNMNVSLADLNLTIKPFSSVNLLDKKHYQYTLQQLETSALQGSIAKKKEKISVRKSCPDIKKKNILMDQYSIPSRGRSILSIKEEKYEELNISDEEFAKDNADTADMDTKPLLTKVNHAK